MYIAAYQQLNRFLQEIALLKERKVEQEKLEEIKVMEYLKQKAVGEAVPFLFTNMVFLLKTLYKFFSLISQQPLIFDVLQEREEAYQRELEIARVEKEKEIARLRAQQERAKDKQAEKVTGKYLHPLPRFHSSFVFIFLV